MNTRITYPSRLTPAKLAQEYPRLNDLTINRGLRILPVYTKSDLMDLFAVCEKTIRRWTTAGLLLNRHLPNRGRCLPSDLEEFLARTESQAPDEECDE
jgi:hypothetical protein